MNILAKTLYQNVLPKFSSSIFPTPSRLISRSFIAMARNNVNDAINQNSMMCSCGCGGRGIHTEGNYTVYNT